MSDQFDRPINCKTHLDKPCTAIRQILEPQEKDLGNVTVRRLMPTGELRSVGPFVFFDHLGPATFPPGAGIDVRPHPHIGLATITYLFAGEILHRDSLGKVQPIRPGEINWMTAGKGIVHSERTPAEVRSQGHTLHALQLWVALPEADEETEPVFLHYAATELPQTASAGCSIRVLIGAAFGLRSAVRTWSPTLYIEIDLEPGASVIVPDQVKERAVYVVSGGLTIQGRSIPRHHLVVFDGSPAIELTTSETSRLVIIGGDPLGKRTVWWNLVSTRKELIEKAKHDWREGRFGEVPGETEKIPLPE